jgi:hypothetical protein
MLYQMIDCRPSGSCSVPAGVKLGISRGASVELRDLEALSAPGVLSLSGWLTAPGKGTSWIAALVIWAPRDSPTSGGIEYVSVVAEPKTTRGSTSVSTICALAAVPITIQEARLAGMTHQPGLQRRLTTRIADQHIPES